MHLDKMLRYVNTSSIFLQQLIILEGTVHMHIFEHVCILEMQQYIELRIAILQYF